MVLFLPFVTEVWQIYSLIFLLQAASAELTPAFQATIPDVQRDERDYTNAQSLMRLAEDLEQLLSPMLASALLTVVSFPMLFGGTVAGFGVSQRCLLSVCAFPPARRLRQEPCSCGLQPTHRRCDTVTPTYQRIAHIWQLTPTRRIAMPFRLTLCTADGPSLLRGFPHRA